MPPGGGGGSGNSNPRKRRDADRYSTQFTSQQSVASPAGDWVAPETAMLNSNPGPSFTGNASNFIRKTIRPKARIPAHRISQHDNHGAGPNTAAANLSTTQLQLSSESVIRSSAIVNSHDQRQVKPLNSPVSNTQGLLAEFPPTEDRPQAHSPDVASLNMQKHIPAEASANNPFQQSFATQSTAKAHCNEFHHLSELHQEVDSVPNTATPEQEDASQILSGDQQGVASPASLVPQTCVGGTSVMRDGAIFGTQELSSKQGSKELAIENGESKHIESNESQSVKVEAAPDSIEELKRVIHDLEASNEQLTWLNEELNDNVNLKNTFLDKIIKAKDWQDIENTKVAVQEERSNQIERKRVRNMCSTIRRLNLSWKQNIELFRMAIIEAEKVDPEFTKARMNEKKYVDQRARCFTDCNAPAISAARGLLLRLPGSLKILEDAYRLEYEKKNLEAATKSATSVDRAETAEGETKVINNGSSATDNTNFNAPAGTVDINSIVPSNTAGSGDGSIAGPRSSDNSTQQDIAQVNNGTQSGNATDDSGHANSDLKKAELETSLEGNSQGEHVNNDRDDDGDAEILQSVKQLSKAQADLEETQEALGRAEAKREETQEALSRAEADLKEIQLALRKAEEHSKDVEQAAKDAKKISGILEGEAANHKHRADSLSRAHQQLSADLANNELLLDGERMVSTRLRSSVKILETQSMEWQGQMTRAKNEIASTNAHLNWLQSENQRLGEGCNAFAEKIAHLHRQIYSDTEKITSLRGSLEDKEKSILKQDIIANQKQVEASDEIYSLRKRLSAAESGIEKLEKQLLAKSSELDTLRHDSDAQCAAHEKAYGDWLDQKYRLDTDLKEKIAALSKEQEKGAVERASFKAAKSSSEIESLREKCEFDSTVKKLESQAEVMKAKITELGQTATSIKDEMNTIISALKVVCAEDIEVKSQLNRASEKLRILNDDLTEKQSILKEKEASLNEKDTEIKNLQVAYEAALMFPHTPPTSIVDEQETKNAPDSVKITRDTALILTQAPPTTVIDGERTSVGSDSTQIMIDSVSSLSKATPSPVAEEMEKDTVMLGARLIPSDYFSLSRTTNSLTLATDVDFASQDTVYMEKRPISQTTTLRLLGVLQLYLDFLKLFFESLQLNFKVTGNIKRLYFLMIGMMVLGHLAPWHSTGGIDHSLILPTPITSLAIVPDKFSIPGGGNLVEWNPCPNPFFPVTSVNSWPLELETEQSNLHSHEGMWSHAYHKVEDTLSAVKPILKYYICMIGMHLRLNEGPCERPQ